jgi:hypothetical protein
MQILVSRVCGIDVHKGIAKESADAYARELPLENSILWIRTIVSLA